MFKPQVIEQEAERLLISLMNINCEPGRVWNMDKCLEIAPTTLLINQLKKETDTIILAHSYVYPELLYGIADYVGDSYFLSQKAKESKAKRILFIGVVFMAETAKILNPNTEVFVLDPAAGCSLADSLKANELEQLQSKYPNATTLCYINSNADIKALSDVCVTSTNVYDIVENIPNNEILFVPDKLMADNIKEEMIKRGVSKTIHSSEGTCIVHDNFDTDMIKDAKERNKDLKIVSHPECTPNVTELSDFVGSTGKMMDYVKNSESSEFMLLTECGLVGRLESELKGKNFTASCKLCPYMKMNTLEKALNILQDSPQTHEVTLEEEVRVKALKSINEMFRYTEAIASNQIKNNATITH